MYSYIVTVICGLIFPLRATWETWSALTFRGSLNILEHNTRSCLAWTSGSLSDTSTQLFCDWNHLTLAHMKERVRKMRKTLTFVFFAGFWSPCSRLWDLCLSSLHRFHFHNCFWWIPTQLLHPLSILSNLYSLTLRVKIVWSCFVGAERVSFSPAVQLVAFHIFL